jgi:hypothetical protein
MKESISELKKKYIGKFFKKYTGDSFGEVYFVYSFCKSINRYGEFLIERFEKDDSILIFKQIKSKISKK